MSKEKDKGIWFKLEEPLSITASMGIPKIGDKVMVTYRSPFLDKGLAHRVSSFDNEDIRNQSVVELGATEIFSAL